MFALTPADSKTGKAKKSRKAKESDRSEDDRKAHTKLVETYFVAYEACVGQKPPFGSREGKAVWTLLDAVGLERAEVAVRNAFSDEWGTTRSIRSVADDPGKFQGPRPRSSTKREVQGGPSDLAGLAEKSARLRAAQGIPDLGGEG